MNERHPLALACLVGEKKPSIHRCTSTREREHNPKAAAFGKPRTLSKRVHGRRGSRVVSGPHKVAVRVLFVTDQKIASTAMILDQASAGGTVDPVSAPTPWAPLMFLHIPAGSFLKPLEGCFIRATHGNASLLRRLNDVLGKHRNRSIFLFHKMLVV